MTKHEAMNIVGFHFTGSALRDGRKLPAIGEWLEYEGAIVPCESGLHASPDPFDALQCASGSVLHQVELDGTIVAHGDPVDKWAASRRRIIRSVDLTAVCRLFAREQALSVIHLWNAPAVVRQYLETGDETIRAAAEEAAEAASRAAWTSDEESHATAWAALAAAEAAAETTTDAAWVAWETEEAARSAWAEAQAATQAS